MYIAFFKKYIQAQKKIRKTYITILKMLSPGEMTDRFKFLNAFLYILDFPHE